MNDVTAKATPLLEIRDLKVHYPIRGGVLNKVQGSIRAIDGISLSINRGETYGLVGESGSGKTTLGRAILGLAPISAGQILFDGESLPERVEKRSKKLRMRIQPVFQDVSNSLNPRRTIHSIVMDPMIANQIADRRACDKKVMDLLEIVELPRAFASRYPHELSGGERQRVGMARALALDPELIVLDEPTSALDVSVQAKIVELLSSIQSQLGLTYLLISHDLALVRNLANRVNVMYLGQSMEEAPVDVMFEEPRNPYTVCLLSAVPDVGGANLDSDRPRLRVLPGDVPSVRKPMIGCSFESRCPVNAVGLCSQEKPPFREVGSLHHSRCHFDSFDRDPSTENANKQMEGSPLK
jgi:peptide/nickel transport system ATP-binding protein